jgi:hypothetical protein
MIVREHSEFAAIRSSDFPEVNDVRAFQASSFVNLVIEPAGKMEMPSHRVVNRPFGDYSVRQLMPILPDGRLPARTDYPKMVLTTLENAYCLPFGPPILQAQRQIFTDFLIPWAPDALGWFAHAGGTVYHSKVDFDPDDVAYDVDVAFYMDHSISGHYGHFIGDCLTRMHAWDVCQSLFGDVKVIIAHGAKPDFQSHLLNAAGVPVQNIININGLARCRRLLLATPSFGVEYYASPTSARLWGTIRDRSAIRDVSLPDRIYMSRSRIKDRKLANESEVEWIFKRNGFTVIRPETLSVKEQIALVSNALLVAGPGGSGMFNLAFQGRLRSAFILAREDFVQLSEMLFCAGRSCDIWYHLGRRVPIEAQMTDRESWVVDPIRLAGDVADWLAEAACHS